MTLDLDSVSPCILKVFIVSSKIRRWQIRTPVDEIGDESATATLSEVVLPAFSPVERNEHSRSLSQNAGKNVQSLEVKSLEDAKEAQIASFEVKSLKKPCADLCLQWDRYY
ncbi:hypothetical protein NPIL_551051 [Nephila pilipes]|uniref:Uncharacterized protein n=1 Tax=Nephila pilipes TaxID=299642 RepID=A0A8X6T6E3_NEPPI|nr:hypothetical protein NPIL_551051 [Nephila pilipes]